MSKDRLTIDPRNPTRTLFEKVCKNPHCRKIFKSSSRNQEYCFDPVCATTRSKKAAAAASRQREYQKNQAARLRATRARRESRALATNYLILVRCWCCGDPDVLVNREVHHVDGDEENRSLWNLSWVCIPCHSKITNGDTAANDKVKATSQKMQAFLDSKDWYHEAKTNRLRNRKLEEKRGEFLLCTECLERKPAFEVGRCPDCKEDVCKACFGSGEHSHAEE